ncbi:MAG TPA: PA0069 family radical SAM protein [Tepidisphaeraceae bacterium]|nr:PA0069 family radical SAM protein [Tepidisphaeraceae bacterium]
MQPIQPTIKGRGTAQNPPNRFERLHMEPDREDLDPEEGGPATPQTVYLLDKSRSIIVSNDSPDVGFSHSINPYRGCSHGCIYCYARITHEYLGFSAGLDFETKIMVKPAAPELLRQELMAPRYKPVTLSISGVTDCYQPAEKHFRITRRCLEVLAEFGNPAAIITKNHMVTRDIDVIAKLAAQKAAVVLLSVTTLDADLARRMEPRTSAPRRRLDAIRELTAAGIPVGVMVAPVIPGLTDHEVPAILKATAEAGAICAAYTPVRLALTIAGLFENWLENHFPDRKDKVLNRIRSMRGGKLNDPRFGSRMHGEGIWADQLKTMFDMGKKAAGITGKFPELSTAGFRRPGGQMELW